MATQAIGEIPIDDASGPPDEGEMDQSSPSDDRKELPRVDTLWNERHRVLGELEENVTRNEENNDYRDCLD